MSSRVEPASGLRVPQAGTRSLARRSRLDLVLATIGRLTYGVLLWLVVIAIVPMIWGWRPTVVVSGSMAPAIRDGDVVVAEPSDPIGLSPGTIVLFRHQSNDELVAHRIVEVDEDGLYVTRGDNNLGVDSTPVTPAEIEGVARMVVPWVGLPAHWLRLGHYLEVIGFVALVGVCVWLGHRPRREVSYPVRPSIRTEGGARAPIIAASSGPATPAPGVPHR